MLRPVKRESVSGFLAVLFCMVVLSFYTDSFAQKIYTVAGGYVGDGNPATSAALNVPQFAAFDSLGDLFISDLLNCRIRKVNTTGIISTIAGTGICGFSGDGGPAVKAKISGAQGIAVDGSGNIYFSDQGNARIRQINTAGTITTFAGKGKRGYCGDGGPALKACFATVWGITISGTDLYLADTDGVTNCRIRKISGGVISTVAGSATCGYSGDNGPATSAKLFFAIGSAVSGAPGSQVLWISDSGNNVIRRADLKTGIITTWWGVGYCGSTLQELCAPENISIDSKGNLYVPDINNRTLQGNTQNDVFALEVGGIGQGFNGDGLLGPNTMLNNPIDVPLDNAGNLYTVDTGNNRIRRGNASTTVQTVAGGYIGDNEPATSAAFNFLSGTVGTGLTFDTNNNLYVADVNDLRIRKISASGIVTTVAGTGITGYTGDSGPAIDATLNLPTGIVADQKGNLFIADSNEVIRKVDSTGTITTLAGGFFVGPPSQLAIDGTGNLYEADYNQCVVWKITPSGGVTSVAGMQGQCGFNGDGILATKAQLSFPLSVAVGPGGNLYITDTGNNRIRVVSGAGTISTIAGDGSYGCGQSEGGSATAAATEPTAGIAVDVAGNVYYDECFGSRVRVVNSSGILETVAGSGHGGYNGNGLAAQKTDLQAEGLAISPSGVLYLADVNSLLRKVQTVTAATLKSSMNPSTSGQPVTFTAQVTGSTGNNPTGTVTFKAGTKTLGKVTLTGGQASLTTSTLPKGSNTITATFNGGTDFTNSSASLVQTVN